MSEINSGIVLAGVIISVVFGFIGFICGLIALIKSILQGREMVAVSQAITDLFKLSGSHSDDLKSFFDSIKKNLDYLYSSLGVLRVQQPAERPFQLKKKKKEEPPPIQ